MTAIIVGEQRNEASGKPSPPEFLSQFTAYFGTYRIDAIRGDIVHNVTTSLNGAQASDELRRHYNIENNTLSLSFSRIRESVEVTSRLVWKRISPP